MAIAPLQLQGFSSVNNAVDPTDWTSLSNLGKVYQQAQNQQKLSDLGKQFAAGSTDYRSAAGQVADMGDINSTLKFLALAEQQRKLDAARGVYKSAFGTPMLPTPLPRRLPSPSIPRRGLFRMPLPMTMNHCRHPRSLFPPRPALSAPQRE